MFYHKVEVIFFDVFNSRSICHHAFSSDKQLINVNIKDEISARYSLILQPHNDALLMEIKDLAKQLRKPEGEAGITTGINMNKGNAPMYELTFSLMDFADNEHMLEIGFGNGKFIPDLLLKALNVHYTGIDFSETMVKEASASNQSLIESGMVEIKNASISAIPYPDESFDKAFTINTIYFWESPEHDMGEIYRVLKKGGSAFICFRPSQIIQQLTFDKHGFTPYDVKSVIELMAKAGFTNITHRQQDEAIFNWQGTEIQMKGICVKGTK